MPSQLSEVDALAEQLREVQMNIAEASPSTGGGWFVRIVSRMDAEGHDTYHTAYGETFTEALAAAVEWTGFLR